MIAGTTICGRCGYEKDLHKDEGVIVGGMKVCWKFLRVKKRWATVRLFLCPLGLHPARAMILTRKYEEGEGEYFCPRCKTFIIMDKDGVVVYRGQRREAV